VPGAANGMIPTSINSEGVVAGTFIDASQAQHAFVRAVNGQITVVDEPKGNASPLSTSAASINGDGTITGVYLDAKNERHGYARLVGSAVGSTPATDVGAAAASATPPTSTTSQPQSNSVSPSSPSSGGGGSMDALGLLLLLAQVSATAIRTTRKRGE
jgi:hypothetical protein